MLGQGQRPQVKKAPITKTSAYLGRYQATKKTAQFWGELTKIAEKAGKIESIDERMGYVVKNVSETGLNTRPRSVRQSVSQVRCQGRIHQDMYGVKRWDTSTSEAKEHNLEGRSMNAILCPDSAE